MSLIELFLLGLALAMDCFAMSITAGIVSKRLVALPMLAMAISFGVFQAGMTLIGFYGISLFSSYIESIDHWVAFVLLGYLGVKMIWESFTSEEGENNRKILAPWSIVVMSIATSIDALAVGISFGCIGLESITLAVLIIGFCSFAMSIVGLSIGLSVGKRINWHVNAIGGLILIGIGVKILIEHWS